MDREKEDITKKMQYILNMRAVLNKNALFSDGTNITGILQSRNREKK